MVKEKVSRILRIALAAVFSLGFLAQFVWLLPYLGTTVGTASGEAMRERSALEFSDAYQRHVNNLSASAMEGIIPIPKSYLLPEDTVIAPAPDQANFGQSADPADTAAVLERDDAAPGAVAFEGEDVPESFAWAEGEKRPAPWRTHVELLRGFAEWGDVARIRASLP